MKLNDSSKKIIRDAVKKAMSRFKSETEMDVVTDIHLQPNQADARTLRIAAKLPCVSLSIPIFMFLCSRFLWVTEATPQLIQKHKTVQASRRTLIYSFI